MIIRNAPGESFHLLTTFKAIYKHGSINGAAEVLGITQSAVSKHLQKLRDWFSDDLFIRTSNGMEPTTKAVTLIVRVEHILQEVALLSEDKQFDPATLSGTFTIATTSEVTQKLLPPLLKNINTQSPNLRITVIHLAADYSIQELEMGKVDLVISVNWHAPEQLIQKRLYSDYFVCLMNKTHPLSKKTLTPQNYAESTHLLVAPLGKERSHIDEQLLALGLKRQVRLSVPDFAQLDLYLLEESFIITLPYRIAAELRKKSQKTLVIKKLPIDTLGVDYYLFWHRRFQNDKVNQWVRDIISHIFLPS